MQNDTSMALNALKMAVMLHALIDSQSPRYRNSYHDYFGTGFWPWQSQTRPGVLIAQCSYSRVPSEIHTPIGYLDIAGSSSGDTTALTRLIFESPDAFKFRLICPGYQTKMGFMGPWYLVTEIGGAKMSDPSLVPDEFSGDAARIYNENDADFGDIITPRRNLLSSLYVRRADLMTKDQFKEASNAVLKEAFASGVIADASGTYHEAREVCATDLPLTVRILSRFVTSELGYVRKSMFARVDRVATALHEGTDEYYKDLMPLIYTGRNNDNHFALQ